MPEKVQTKLFTFLKQITILFLVSGQEPGHNHFIFGQVLYDGFELKTPPLTPVHCMVNLSHHHIKAEFIHFLLELIWSHPGTKPG